MSPKSPEPCGSGTLCESVMTNRFIFRKRFRYFCFRLLFILSRRCFILIDWLDLFSFSFCGCNRFFFWFFVFSPDLSPYSWHLIFLCFFLLLDFFFDFHWFCASWWSSATRRTRLTGLLSSTSAFASGSVLVAIPFWQAIFSIYFWIFSATGVFGLSSVILSAFVMCSWFRRNLGGGGLGGLEALLLWLESSSWIVETVDRLIGGAGGGFVGLFSIPAVDDLQ